MQDCPSVETPFDHGPRRQAIVRAILTDIFQGNLHAGQRLVTDSLAVRFRVSHTPIREALIELRGIGVVDLLPNRGAVVRKVTARTVREVCQVRRVLECEAIRGATRRVDSRVWNPSPPRFANSSPRRPMRARWPSARELDNRLHDLIRESCGNAFLTEELNRLQTLFQTFRDVTWDLEVARHDYHRIGVEAAEHLAIMAALWRAMRRPQAARWPPTSVRA